MPKGPEEPKLTPDQRKARRKANESARDQFAALGNFIQGFEGIVRTLRWHCHRIMLGDHLGIMNPDGRVLMTWWNITSMVFHHDSLTAKSLMDIWRALLAEEAKGLRRINALSEKGEAAVLGISTEIGSEFEDIYQNRNRIIHATWGIGRWWRQEDISELIVEKYKVGADGFTKREDLPKNFDELMALGVKCRKLNDKFGRFLQYYHYHPADVERVFVYSKKAEKWSKWSFVSPTFTLTHYDPPPSPYRHVPSPEKSE